VKQEMNTEQEVLYKDWGKAIGVIGFIVMAAAMGWLLWSGQTDIRYTGDHEGTIPVWNIWIPSLVCIMLIRMIPMHLPRYNPFEKFTKEQLKIPGILLLSGAILFPIALLLVDHKNPSFQLWYVGIKLTLLFILPWIVIHNYRSKTIRSVDVERPASLTRWMWLSPLFVAGVWMYLSYFSVFSTPPTASKITDPSLFIIILLFGFLINSLLEELFYRVWLQTRLEKLIGAWPAIFLTAILWAVWHITIHGTGQWSTDIVAVICHQGITGIFLGYLWFRFRNVWVLILIHGIINAPPHLLLELMTM
jgi:membrane protease YdiL (CAAX protease family)